MRISAFSALRSLTLSFLALGLLSLAAFAQDDNKNDVLRIETNLIQTDVTVLDKSGKPVTGIKPEQFVLKVDGKPTQIDFFEPVSASMSGFSVGNDAEKKTSPDATSPSDVSLRERRYVFFVDDFHLALDSMTRTRSAIAHFIDNDMMPRDQVLIVSASGNLGFLQQFTTNKAILHAALNKLRVYPNTYRDGDNQPPMPEYVAVRILNNDMQAAEFYIEKLQRAYQRNSLEKAAALDMIKQRANQIVTGMANSTKATLNSLENTLVTTGMLKGRKIIFLFSDGFYLEDKQTPYTTTEGLQRALNLATRSGASIYTIDARGLFSLSGGDATGERPFDPQGRVDKGMIGESGASQEGLATLSNMTGGRFLKNQNYFDKWIDRTVDENTSYYVLAWTPEKDEHLNKKFKSIEVSITGRPDLTVRFQRGYLTAWDKPEPKGKDDKTAKKKLLPAKLAVSFLDVPNVGTVLNSSVQVASNALNFGEKNDTAATLDIFGKVLDLQEKQVGDFQTRLTLKPPVAGTDSSQEQDVIYNAKNPLPPGVYQVQVFVRENQTGNVNTVAQFIEIPDLTTKQLTISSLFLGGKPIGDPGAAQGPAQVQFSVDNRFNHPVKLDFTSFVYNAARADNGNGDTNLATRIEVLDNDGKTIIDSDLLPLMTRGNKDMTRIPVRAAIRQALSTPGRYLLRMTVADNIAKTKAVQQAVFTIE